MREEYDFEQSRDHHSFELQLDKDKSQKFQVADISKINSLDELLSDFKSKI